MGQDQNSYPLPSPYKTYYMRELKARVVKMGQDQNSPLPATPLIEHSLQAGVKQDMTRTATSHPTFKTLHRGVKMGQDQNSPPLPYIKPFTVELKWDRTRTDLPLYKTLTTKGS